MDLKAIILAAGRGSRMGNLTSNAPKCFMKLHGKPLIEWQLATFKDVGIHDIAIVRGYLGGLFKYDVCYFDNFRWDQTNMVMSLACANEWLEENTCVISYADIIYPVDTIEKLIKGRGDIVITYDRKWLELWEMRFVNPLLDAETFQVDNNGTLLEIGNKAKTIEEIEGQYMGLAKFTPHGWKQVKGLLSSLTRQQCDSMDMTTLFDYLLKSGVLINTIQIIGKWYEFDSVRDYELYNSLVEQNGNQTWVHGIE